MHKIYTNPKDGLEAIITEGNVDHPYRVILRDTDARETVAVIFGSLDICYSRAMEFVGDGTPSTETPKNEEHDSSVCPHDKCGECARESAIEGQP